MPVRSFYLFADEVDDFVKDWVEDAQNLWKSETLKALCARANFSHLQQQKAHSISKEAASGLEPILRNVSTKALSKLQNEVITPAIALATEPHAKSHGRSTECMMMTLYLHVAPPQSTTSTSRGALRFNVNTCMLSSFATLNPGKGYRRTIHTCRMRRVTLAGLFSPYNLPFIDAGPGWKISCLARLYFLPS